MKNLRRAAIALTLLASGSFVVAQIYGAVTVVPWRESWRDQLVARWNAASIALLSAAALAWIALVIVRARNRAV